MVNLVEDWEDMEHYSAQVMHGTACAYQTSENKGKVEVRVLVGKYGYIKQFDDLNDPLLSHILNFCSQGKYLNVNKTIPDDKFFK